MIVIMMMIILITMMITMITVIIMIIMIMMIIAILIIRGSCFIYGEKTGNPKNFGWKSRSAIQQSHKNAMNSQRRPPQN